MVWVVVVEVGMTIMEGSHESFVWRVVWVAVVEAGMATIEGSHGLSMRAPKCYEWKNNSVIPSIRGLGPSQEEGNSIIFLCFLITIHHSFL